MYFVDPQVSVPYLWNNPVLLILFGSLYVQRERVIGRVDGSNSTSQNRN